MHHVEKLEEAIKRYNFPFVYHDFNNNVKVIFKSIKNVEVEINEKLLSKSINDVKDGLSNVIYWGYAQIGYRDKRVADFREKVKNKKLSDFISLVKADTPSLKEIKDLELPQFSGMSFISKVLMFIDPGNYCVLDKQIAKLKNTNTYEQENCLDQLTYNGETQIRITANNSDAYNLWRATCINISKSYYNSKYRCVDIERGFFTLIQNGHEATARQILNSIYRHTA